MSLRRAALAGVLALVSLGVADYLGGLRHAAQHHSWVVALTAAFARPHAIGQRVRINSGAMGGLFDGVIIGAGLLYTTMLTDDGLLHLPNSALLGAAIGSIPPATTASQARQDQRPTETVGDDG